MVWNGIERNKLDCILTDMLPVELSELFSYSKFYEYLTTNSQYKAIKTQLSSVLKNKAEGKDILKPAWATQPLKYNIMKNNDTYREMSVPQPLSVINAFFFLECYQKDILHLFTAKPHFSIRYHKKNTHLYYKKKDGKITEYFHEQMQTNKKNAIQQTGVYFKICPWESINSFLGSKNWHMLNLKYEYYAQIDYKSCFDSIYTHSYTWIIERNTTDAKNALRTNTLFIAIDRIMQNINGRFSHGIIVGPEFSRMIAEVLLQHIDYLVRMHMAEKGFQDNANYIVFRYVDDIYIFADNQKLVDYIIEAYMEIGKKYMLHINEQKISKGDTPFLPKEWLEKTKILSDTISHFFDKSKKKDYPNLSKEQQYLVSSEHIPVDRIKDEVAVLVKTYPDSKRKIVSYLLTTFINNFSLAGEGYQLFQAGKLNKALLLLDLIFYIYSFFPSFDQTRKVISIISYINSEFDFINHEEMKDRLLKIIWRYAFIYQETNIFDICDWLPFMSEYKIQFDTTTEEAIINKVQIANDPIIWANLLKYSQYNNNMKQRILSIIEPIIIHEINKITECPMMQREFWYVLIFHNCPLLSSYTLNTINTIINNEKNHLTNIQKKECAHYMSVLVYDFLSQISSNGSKPLSSFFNWSNNMKFSKQVAFRTYQRTLFRKNKKNHMFLETSID